MMTIHDAYERCVSSVSKRRAFVSILMCILSLVLHGNPFNDRYCDRICPVLHGDNMTPKVLCTIPRLGRERYAVPAKDLQPESGQSSRARRLEADAQRSAY
jgi:hypothetical protein